jgi:hypothetical protein
MASAEGNTCAGVPLPGCRVASEKERPVVFITNEITIPLETFIEDLRVGVVSGFLKLEDECLSAIANASAGRAGRP